MRRREFIAGLGSAAAWPVAAWAPSWDFISTGLNRRSLLRAAPFPAI
jgi:hypothetical protein